MKDLKKLKKIRDILAETYGGSIRGEKIEELADEIYDCAFTKGFDLADIIIILTEMEEGNDEKAMETFHAVVDCMDDNALTAQKLYCCFLENFEDWDVLCKLLNQNAEWLSPDQNTRIREAAKCFDKEILKMCIWNWDDEE